MDEPLKVGFIGVGQMGSVLIERLRGAGHPIHVFDADPEVQDRCRAAGFVVVDSSAEAASGASVVFLCLPDANAVEAVVAGSPGAASWEPAPELCVDLTSSLPSVTRRVSQVLAKRGIRLLDAPVSGGVSGAREGKLTVMAGGDETALNFIRPLLATFASSVIWSGALGAGHAMKAFNNALSAASLIGTAEGVVAGTRAGMSAAQVIDAINSGNARSQNSEVKYPRDVLTGQFNAGFRLGLCYKDVTDACLVAEEIGFPIPMASRVRDILHLGVQKLGADADFTRIYQVVAPDRRSAKAGADKIPAAESTILQVALFGILLAASVEMVGLAKASGIEAGRALEVFNLSSGRNECTRYLSSVCGGIEPGVADYSANTVWRALRWMAARGAPQERMFRLAPLAAEQWETIVAHMGPDADAWGATDGLYARQGGKDAR